MTKMDMATCCDGFGILAKCKLVNKGKLQACAPLIYHINTPFQLLKNYCSMHRSDLL
jgi:hypothetical protein